VIGKKTEDSTLPGDCLFVCFFTSFCASSRAELLQYSVEKKRANDVPCGLQIKEAASQLDRFVL
jgi:hypothetical protein